MIPEDIDWNVATPEQIRLGLNRIRDWKLRILHQMPFTAADECLILARAAVFCDQLTHFVEYMRQRMTLEQEKHLDQVDQSRSLDK